MVWRCNYLVTKKIDCVGPMLELTPKNDPHTSWCALTSCLLMIWRCSYLVSKKIDGVDPMLGLTPKNDPHTSFCASTVHGHEGYTIKRERKQRQGFSAFIPDTACNFQRRGAAQRSGMCLWSGRRTELHVHSGIKAGLKEGGGGEGLKHLLVTDSLHNSLCHGGSVSLTALPVVVNV